MKLGIYETNHIYNEDCIVGMRNMPAECIDEVVTDPPYLVGYKTHHRPDDEHRFCREILNDNNPELIRQYFVECYRIAKPNTALYSFCDIDTMAYFRECIEAAGYAVKNTIVWSKGGGGMGDLERTFAPDYEILLFAIKGDIKLQGKRCGSVWDFPKVPSGQLIHQNQKPVGLIMRAIEYHSKEGDVIFDGFIGGGTTAVAARKLRRQYIGFELDGGYYKVAVERVEKEFAQMSFFWD